MRPLVVIPMLDTAIGDPCIDSIAREDSALGIPVGDVLVVDNTRDEAFCDVESEGFAYYRDEDGHNLGTSRAWNIGARRVLYPLDGEPEYDHLVIASSVLRFGPILHTTWREQMERFDGHNVIECDGHSWHLIAFHRRVFETVGLFDENFYPAYVEGIDFGRRLALAGMEGGWPRPWVNVMSDGVARHVEHVSCPFAPLGAYYESKWGGKKGEERWSLPFNRDDVGLDYWEPISVPEIAARYQLENWW